MLETNIIHNTDCLTGLREMPDKVINCCVTSPPYYGLRDYGVDGQIGLEETPEMYVEKLVKVFDEVRRVLKDDGTLWLNLGDSYAGSGKGVCDRTDVQKEVYVPKPGGKESQMNKTPSGLKPKDLIGIPWMVAFALRASGWYLRSEIIWYKRNPMPESVTDRPTKAHEQIFLLSKSQRYYYDADAIKEDAVTEPTVRDKNKEGYVADYANGDRFSPGERIYGAEGKRNKRDVWDVTTKPFSEAHFATFPGDLISPCLLAGCPENGIVLDPFMGAGTTALVARKLGRQYVGFELNPEYIEIANKRIYNEIGLFF